jgi:stage IV sporulation protein FB
VRLHATFPLVFVAFGLEGLVRAGWGEALYAMLFVAVMFVCVVAHELGHSLQARRYGIVVRDIVLLPIGGMARAERIPDNPRQEIVMAIAGPAVNFVVAGVILVCIRLFHHTIDFEEDFVSGVLFVNIALAVFNLVPAFPMDGGRILRGILATRLPYLTATRLAKNLGLVIAQIFAVVGFAFTQLVMLPLIAVFIFAGAITEERFIREKLLGGDAGDESSSFSHGPPW